MPEAKSPGKCIVFQLKPTTNPLCKRCRTPMLVCVTVRGLRSGFYRNSSQPTLLHDI
jgi:hypothetical protein